MLTRILLTLGILALLLVAGCSDNAPVQQEEGGPGTVTFQVYDQNTRQIVTPDWIAFQDGVNGIWTPLTGSDLHTVDVTDAAGAYGFAFVVDRGGYSYLEIMHATRSDDAAVVYPVWISDYENYAVRGEHRQSTRSTRGGGTWNLYGDFTNIADGMDFRCTADDEGSTWGEFASLDDVDQYNWGFESDVNRDAGYLFGDTDGDAEVDGCVYLRRDLNEADGASIQQNIDFDPSLFGDGYTFGCSRRSFSVPGADECDIRLFSRNGLRMPLDVTSDTSPFTYFSLSPSALLDTDRYVYWARGNGSTIRCISTTPITSQTLIAPFTFTVDQSNGIVMEGLDHPEANLYDFSFYSEGNSSEAMVVVTTAWLQAAGVTDYTLPDLSGVDGWQTAWGAPVTGPLYYAGGEAAYCNDTPSRYLLSWSTDEYTFLGPNFISKYSWYDAVD